MLVDEEKTIELALAQPGNALCHHFYRARIISYMRHGTRPLQIIQCDPHPAQPAVLPSRVLAATYFIFAALASFQLI